MARGGIPGMGAGTGPITLMVIGFVGGIITDMMWQSLGLPGYNAPLQGCDSLTIGDAIQIGGTGGLTFFGFLTKSRELPAFTFGLMLGGLFPKVMTKAIGLPRYGIFDIGEGGGISPVASFRQPGKATTTAGKTPLQSVGAEDDGEGFISKMKEQAGV